MAEINNTKGKKLSTRVNLTPMVDLGFLLITFFIFATTLALPKAVKFRVPNDNKDNTIFTKMLTQSAITALVSDSTGRYYCYIGDKPAYTQEGLQYTDIAGLRKIILKLKQQIVAQNIPESLISLQIKALPKAKYGDFVAVFDEVTINNISNYFKVAPDNSEIQAVNEYNVNNKLPALTKEI